MLLVSQLHMALNIQFEYKSNLTWIMKYLIFLCYFSKHNYLYYLFIYILYFGCCEKSVGSH